MQAQRKEKTANAQKQVEIIDFFNNCFNSLLTSVCEHKTISSGQVSHLKINHLEQPMTFSRAHYKVQQQTHLKN
jgi:S-adenosylmethionine hydrolase